MKKLTVVFFALVFLMLVGNVLAMDDPIRVKAKVGDKVQVIAWPPEFGPSFNSDVGLANEDGYFTSKIFFSLNVDNFVLQVSVNNGNGTTMGRFEGMNSLSPIFVDCISTGDCELSSWDVEEVVVENEVVIENETIENETVVENDRVVIDEDMVNSSDEFSLTGKAIFFKEDGSFNFGYLIGGIVIVLFMVVLVFMIIHRGKKNVSIADADDKELAYAENRVKDTEDKIKKIKDHDVKMHKLEEARVKLVADEKELEELEKKENEGDNVEEKIEKQEAIIEKVESDIEKTEDNQAN